MQANNGRIVVMDREDACAAARSRETGLHFVGGADSRGRPVKGVGSEKIESDDKEDRMASAIGKQQEWKVNPSSQNGRSVESSGYNEPSLIIAYTPIIEN